MAQPERTSSVPPFKSVAYRRIATQKRRRYMNSEGMANRGWARNQNRTWQEDSPNELDSLLERARLGATYILLCSLDPEFKTEGHKILKANF